MDRQLIIKRFGIFIVGSVACYLLRFLPPPGADGYFISNLIETSPFPIYYRSVLTVLIHKWCYAVLSPLGWNGWDAMTVSSSLAGGVAIMGLSMLSRHPLFFAVNMLSGSFLVFFGHAENYAWVNAFLILSYIYFFKWMNGKSSLVYGIVFYTLACLSHKLAIFYLPAVVYLLWMKRDYHPLEWLLPLLSFLFILLLLPVFFTVLGTDNGLERLVPLLHTWSPNHFFTFFSIEHLNILAYFHYRASWLGIFPIPYIEWYLGLPIELPLLFLFRKRINTLFLKFMLIHVICGLAWTAVWHPDWGYNDWDLFSQFGIPLHVLLGLLLVQKKTNEKTA